MRQLKFRFWNKSASKFVDIALFHKYIIDSDLINIYCTNYFNSKYYICQQFTGLYDKNQTPIYEGDFLKVAFIDKLGVETSQFNKGVKWLDAGFNLSEAKEKNFYTYEIIGNILENPELLETP